MDNICEATGTKRKREDDETSSTSEGYTSPAESTECDSPEDASDLGFTSNGNYETIFFEGQSDFSPDDGTGRTIKVEIRISRRTWQDIITAKCTHEGKAIGRAIALFTRRNMITRDFREEMSECSVDLGMLAWRLFDRYGFLKDKFKLHPVHRGTGAWGSELDDGPLLVIEEVYIFDAEWRRKGVGRAVVRQLLVASERCANSERFINVAPELIILNYGSLERFQKLNTVHAILMPGWIVEDVEPQYVGKSKRQQHEINLQASNTADLFWRSLGFRRVGSSPCFAYSFDPNHISRSIPPNRDFDPQMEPLDDQEDDQADEPHMEDYILPYSIEIQLGKRTLSTLRKEFPLHHAATTLSDLECVEYLKKAATEDEIDFTVVDRTQRTLLHTLARQLKPESIKWLLANFEPAISWKAARDINGDSPLDVLKEFLEDIRTKRHMLLGYLDVSDQFRGFSSPAIECLSLLDSSLSCEDPNLSTSRLKYGCTCGQCIAGFFSPRMKLALLVQAALVHEFLSEDIDDGQFWVECNDFWLRYVAYDVRQNFKTNKSIRRGFANVFSYVHKCLESNHPPALFHILPAIRHAREWPPVTRRYLTRAGIVPGIEAALACVFHAARNEDDRTGNGEFQRIYASQYSALSVCRNDREFQYVAWACGLDLELE